jgi:hypothetical protein
MPTNTKDQEEAKNRYHAAIGFALLSGVFFAIAIVLTGCSADGTGGTGQPIGVGAACTVDKDCNPGLECEHGACRQHRDDDADDDGDAGPSCNVDADCAAGQECDDGACKDHDEEHRDAGPSCNVDADCAAGQECDDGACKDHDEEHRDAGPSCNIDADCAAGQECDDGRCKDHGDDGPGHS